MKIIKTSIPEVIIFEPTVYGDDRGYFCESFNQRAFENAVGRPVNFVQDNHSKSRKGVLRGLHYQLAPQAQGKLVRCTVGEVFDVAVDIRQGSATYGKWVGVILSAENKRQLWIPEGFAHGFMALSESVEFLYKTTNYYSPQHERSIRWDDAEIGIAWPNIDVELIISEKDKLADSLNSSLSEQADSLATIS
ncbi:dTDP-4-dehydrorhamnose 3,5-epimerase [Candidatus Pantoea floridensis]|uniref:dTDP-4-dehydrorhamnose 3,5-epimerase n=1 Tax=Candidatus Pantoea floridensis TaxID=1938870 RepID=A0A286BVJ3_9GAMM|nr:dTDP-4-dehydrorhamnose 3,5-epimerase [Pantoea floridensis]PIF20663.1 dTDP-4-dehydrorhamnose 3,5-epimerase [Enterobacteriaceae bacterium JKS000233]SOD38180.1 dTDP-4-dehydrorhamnose 3,5-epimerase [Pantoea floridensis]